MHYNPARSTQQPSASLPKSIPFEERPVQIVCLDLEGVLVPEIWIEVSKGAGIPELARTTRDEPDYDKLMRARIEILNRREFRLADIREVVAGMQPLPGAREFLAWARERFQVVILSDTYYEIATPLMKLLGWPTLFAHELVVDASGRVHDYRLRITDQKRAAVKAFRRLNFHTVAAGDSYNDTAMLAEAHAGILFCPPDNVAADFPRYPVARTYAELQRDILAVSRSASA